MTVDYRATDTLRNWALAFKAQYGFLPTRLWVDRALYDKLLALASNEYVFLGYASETLIPRTAMQLTLAGIPVEER